MNADIFIPHFLYFETHKIGNQDYNFSDEEDSFEQMISHAGQMNAKRIILTHIEATIGLGHDELNKAIKDAFSEYNIELGYDGMIINLRCEDNLIIRGYNTYGKEADFTGTACGAGGEWCHSSAVASNPSCSFTIPTPSEGTDYYYPYIIDNHNFQASGGDQGSTQSFTVNNVAPTVSSVTLNSGSDITLTENTTTSVSVTATVSDNNGCGDINSATTSDVSIYRSGIGWSGCDTVGEDNEN